MKNTPLRVSAIKRVDQIVNLGEINAGTRWDIAIAIADIEFMVLRDRKKPDIDFVFDDDLLKSLRKVLYIIGMLRSDYNLLRMWRDDEEKEEK